RSEGAAVQINIELPAGYHLNPSAPQRYQVILEQDGKESTITPKSFHSPPVLPIHLPVGLPSTGVAEIRASFTLVYCREDNTGTCRIKTLMWRVPLQIVSDASAPAEINLQGKVMGE